MKNINKIKYSLALVLFSVTLQAQESFPDNVNDVPIDDWVIPVALSGIIIMYFLTKRKKKPTK
jgi:hypothetical protein